MRHRLYPGLIDMAVLVHGLSCRLAHEDHPAVHRPQRRRGGKRMRHATGARTQNSHVGLRPDDDFERLKARCETARKRPIPPNRSSRGPVLLSVGFLVAPAFSKYQMRLPALPHLEDSKAPPPCRVGGAISRIPNRSPRNAMGGARIVPIRDAARYAPASRRSGIAASLPYRRRFLSNPNAGAQNGISGARIGIRTQVWNSAGS